MIYDTPILAKRKLMELGVPLEPLQRSMRAGFDGRGLCTENDPPFIPGTEAWRYTVRTLREGLLPLGWRKADPGNYSIVSSDERKLNIVVATADQFVKRTAGDPRTNSLKGLYTAAAIARNAVVADLFPDTIPDNIRVTAASLEHPTWMLLIYITDEEFRGELSFPEAIEDKTITSWSDRIFIPSDEDSASSVETDSDDSEYDILVRRRA